VPEIDNPENEPAPSQKNVVEAGARHHLTELLRDPDAELDHSIDGSTYRRLQVEGYDSVRISDYFTNSAHINADPANQVESQGEILATGDPIISVDGQKGDSHFEVLLYRPADIDPKSGPGMMLARYGLGISEQETIAIATTAKGMQEHSLTNPTTPEDQFAAKLITDITSPPAGPEQSAAH